MSSRLILRPDNPVSQSLSAYLGRKNSTLQCMRVQQRFLNLHEYQSMQLMQSFDIPVPKFQAVKTPEAAREAASLLLSTNKNGVVVKAQVLAGGRGLGYFQENGFKGGVHACQSPEEAMNLAEKMLNKTLITKQTGATGRPCHTLLVSEKADVERERYIAVLLDRSSGGPVIIGSAIGGTSIEDIAAKYPEAIVKLPLDIRRGLPDASRIDAFLTAIVTPPKEKLSEGPALSPEDITRLKTQLHSLLTKVYNLFQSRDCLMVEMNPLVETHGNLLVCDAKIHIDDNSSFRQTELFSKYRDTSQDPPLEVFADSVGLNYIQLDGNIGCMVNGAGLAMATMDMIHIHGGKPANFLDVGGGANCEQIMHAFELFQRPESQAHAVFINIFGGIMRCDTIAQGLVQAIQNTGFQKPVVIRLEGTNKDQAEKILAEAMNTPLFKNVQICNDFDKAAKRVVELSK